MSNSPGTAPVQPRLILISGPIASGKSTAAAELAALARARGSSVAVTDLDTVAEMALPTLPDWEIAHRIHGALVGLWLSTEIDLVIDEGTSSRHEVGLVLEQAPAGTRVCHAVLTADLSASHARALGDIGRGSSRDLEFLRVDHARVAAEDLAELADVLIDVEGRTPRSIAQEIFDRSGLPSSGV